MRLTLYLGCRFGWLAFTPFGTATAGGFASFMSGDFAASAAPAASTCAAVGIVPPGAIGRAEGSGFSGVVFRVCVGAAGSAGVVGDADCAKEMGVSHKAAMNTADA